MTVKLSSINNNTLGSRNTLGDDNTLGDYNTLGNWNTLGDDNTLGDGFKFGKNFQCERVKVLGLMTLANVDDSGRKVHVYVHTHGIKIVAGRFSGSLDEFCSKADSEGKTRYVKIVRAAAEALAEDIKEKGETGGWEPSDFE